MNIPEFINQKLPPGIHECTLDEFKEVFGFNHKRRIQIKGLERAIEKFVSAGAKVLYIDGSFVTTKNNPGDYDACYSLEQLDPLKCTELGVLLDPSKKGREQQKFRYGGEFFPGSIPADRIGTLYIDFFQRDKETGTAKGIIALKIGGEE